MELRLKIDGASYRKHALEQEGQPVELCRQLREDLARVVKAADRAVLNLTAAILAGTDDVVEQVTVYDRYVDLMDGDDLD